MAIPQDKVGLGPMPKPSLKRPVSKPKRALPADAWDCHAHVFGPFDKYPVLLERRYDPPLAPAEDYLAMLDTVGFKRGVVVHAQAKGNSNSNAADTIARQPGRVLGVGYASPDASDADFRKLHDQGFRALRFTENGRRAKGTPGSLDFDDLKVLGPRLKEMGWHAHIWGRCDLVVAARKELASYGLPVIFDHMGFFTPQPGGPDALFRSFVDLLKQEGYFAKLTVLRVSNTPLPHDDIRPYHDLLLSQVPDQVVFGSDWPYLSLDDNPPDVAHFVDLFDAWTADDTLRRKVFVDNPPRFFGAR